MWSMAVAIGIAAVWFEWSYRRNRPAKKKEKNIPPKKGNASARNPAPKQVKGSAR